MRGVALMRPQRAAAADLLRGARGRRSAARGAGPAAGRDHASPSCCASAATARSDFGKWHLGEARARSGPTRRASTSSLGFYSGASMYLPEDDPDVVNSVQDFDPIDRFLWANLPFAVRKDGSEPFEPVRLHDRLPRRRGGARDRGEPQSPVLPVPRVQRAAHAAPGAAPDYDALAGIENHTAARLRAR